MLARTSALENVELPLLYRGEPAKVRHERVSGSSRKVGLTPWKDHTPAELSEVSSSALQSHELL